MKHKHQIIDGKECKYCAKCGLFVEITNFAKNKNTWDGLHCHCFPCKRKLAKKHYTNNSEPIKEKSKKWAQENKEERREYQKQYQQINSGTILQNHKVWKDTNREYIREQKRLYERERRQNTEYRVLSNLRNRLRRAVKGSKSDNTVNLIGCHIDALKLYLEGLFQPGMTWDNYGKWHIDHIVPCASFDLSKEEEQKRCFYYTNLQPLWAIDNIKKRDKLLSSPKSSK